MKSIDPDLASGMQKLTRESWPVKLPARPLALQAAQKNLLALLEVKNKRSLAKKIFKADSVFDDQIKQAQEIVDLLEKDVIEGELTPLTEMEVWGVRAHFTHMLIYIKGQLLKAGDTNEIKAANDAAEKTIDLLGNQYWNAKWIGYSLKRKDSKGNFEPYWAEARVPEEVEPQTLASLWFQYHQAFSPTENELKKSVAPMTHSRN